MPRVLNKRTDYIPSNAVYVGRPSKWGNPYRVGEVYLEFSDTPFTREQAVKCYRFHLALHPKLVKEAKEELRGKDLVCWCAPLPCHADILLELANPP